MALIVQKYGGTSVGNVDRIQHVAAKIKEQWSKGNRIVVVVSARSGVTNDLIARAKALSKLPDEREMDVLMAVGEQETIALTVMALHAIGVPAVHDHRCRVDLGSGVAGVLKDLAARDAHPVVGRGHIDEVRRVHIERNR